MASFADLPPDVLEHILSKLLITGTLYDMFKFALSSKLVLDVLQNAEVLCKDILDKLNASPKIYKLVSREKTTTVVSQALKSKNYCSVCFKHGMKRAYEAFDNKYMCNDCMRNECVLAYDLINTYCLPASHVNNLPYVAKDFYSRHSGHIELKLVYKPKANKVCRKLYNMSIDERKQHLIDLENARQLEKEEKRKQSREHTDAKRKNRLETYTKYLVNKNLDPEVFKRCDTFQEHASKAMAPISEANFIKKYYDVIKTEYDQILGSKTCIENWKTTKDTLAHAETAIKLYSMTYHTGSTRHDINYIRNTLNMMYECVALVETHLPNKENKVGFALSMYKSGNPNAHIRREMLSLSREWAHSVNRRVGCMFCGYSADAMTFRCHLWDQHRLGGEFLSEYIRN